MDNNTVEKHWRLFYKIGAVSVFLAVLGMLTEIFLTALPDGNRAELTVEQLFDMYNRNRFMAMRYMGLMNIIASTLMLPVFFSLYGLYRRNLKVLVSFTLILSLAGYVIFMADNTAFACLELAEKYSREILDPNKTILLAPTDGNVRAQWQRSTNLLNWQTICSESTNASQGPIFYRMYLER